MPFKGENHSKNYLYILKNNLIININLQVEDRTYNQKITNKTS